MTEVSYHVWNLDGRTLCDVKSVGTAVDDPPPGVTVCGACIVVADQIRANAVSLRVRFGDPISTPAEAVESMRGTRWDATRAGGVDGWLQHLAEIEYHYPNITPDQRRDYEAYAARKTRKDGLA